MTNLPKGSALLMVTALLACGCEQQDTDRLSRIARVTAAKVQSLRGKSSEPLLPGWETGLGARVSARLRWDKVLDGAQVDVRSRGNEITLQGTVRDATQRLKAMELANSTVGTESVVDELKLTVDEP